MSSADGLYVVALCLGRRSASFWPLVPPSPPAAAAAAWRGWGLVPIAGWSLGWVGLERGEEEGGGVRSGPGEARTILLLHMISARPSKQPLMVLTFLKVYMELGFLYFVSARTKINNNKKKHHNHWLRGKLLLVFICALEYPVAAHTGSYFLFLQEQIKDIIIMDHERRSIALETACIPHRH